MSQQLILAIGRESGSGGSIMTSTARGIGAARSVMIWSLTARGWESPPRRRCWPNTFWPGPEDARPPQSELYS